VLQRALATGAQVWVTGTRERLPEADSQVFHVEQGRLRLVV
jgi:hypothetical protein